MSIIDIAIRPNATQTNQSVCRECELLCLIYNKNLIFTIVYIDLTEIKTLLLMPLST